MRVILVCIGGREKVPKGGPINSDVLLVIAYYIYPYLFPIREAHTGTGFSFICAGFRRV
jgi:hypothetical protein